MGKNPSMIQRVTNWPEILAAEVFARRHQVFSRSQADCVRTIADIVQKICGVDPLGADWRSAYATDEEARDIIRSARGELLPLFRARLRAAGFEEISPEAGQRGDIAYVRETTLQHGAALFFGSGLLTPDKIGFKVIPRIRAIAAWRV